MTLSLKRSLLMLYLVEFIFQFSMSFVYPFLPLYIRFLGIKNIAEVSLLSGIVLFIRPVLATVFHPIWGNFATVFGCRSLLFRAILSAGVIVILMGIVSDVYQLLVLSALQGMLAGVSTIILVYLSQTSTENELGYSIGLLQLSMMLGNILGPVVGGILIDSFGYFYTFLFSGFVIVSSALLVLVFLSEKPRQKPSVKLGRIVARTFQTGMPRELTLLMWIALFVTFMGYAFVQPFMPFFISNFGISEFQIASTTGLVTAISSFALALSAPVFGKISARFEHKKVLAVALCTSGLFVLPQAYATGITEFTLLRTIQCAFAGAVFPVSVTILSIRTTEEDRGKTLGFLNTGRFLGSGIGPLLGGALVYLAGYNLTFITVFLFIVTIAVAIGYKIH